MNAGIVLAKWFKHEARRVYMMLDESDTERDRRRLIEWLAHKGGTVTAREVQMGCRWLREPGAAETALEELVRAGAGTWQNIPTTAKGGRPARAFVLVNAVNCQRNPTKPEEFRGCVDVDRVDARNSPNPEDSAAPLDKVEEANRRFMEAAADDGTPPDEGNDLDVLLDGVGWV
jgi:hypothetical protein